MPHARCEDHADLVAELARATERARSLEHERDGLTTAVLSLEGKVTKLDERLVAVKLQLARWGGVIATIAALPLLIQLAQMLIRAAEAAGR